MDNGLCVNVECVVINCVDTTWEVGFSGQLQRTAFRLIGVISLVGLSMQVAMCTPDRVMFHCTQLHARENYGVKYLSQASGQYLPAYRA